MPMKHSPEPLMEAADDSGVRAVTASTPHRIKLPSPDDPQQRQQQTPSAKSSAKLAALRLGSHGPRKPVAAQRHRATAASNNHKLTEYFPVRRSVRRTKRAVLEQRQRDLESKLICGIEEGLEIRKFLGKGRGIVATRDFAKGEFVVEYEGELIDLLTAKKREAKYAKDQNAGCYMYYFQHRNQQYCVDATAESNRLGRLVNHSRNGNLVTRIVEVGKQPRLILVAKDDIAEGTELCYDYGDRSRESIRNHPWLAL